MIEDKTVLAITLARGGSKTIPRENIVDLCGHPLIWYTLKEVFESKYIDDYYVSTDDNEIAQVCGQFKVEVILRPSDLAKDTSTSSDSLLHAVNSLEDYDYVVEIMATNPLKTVDDIDRCIELLCETEADSVVAVDRVYDHHPSRLKYIKDGRLKDFFYEIPESRRQDLQPPAYVRCGSVYAMKTSFLRSSKARYGPDTVPYIMPTGHVINIDEPMDLKIAHEMIEP